MKFINTNNLRKLSEIITVFLFIAIPIAIYKKNPEDWLGALIIFCIYFFLYMAHLYLRDKKKEVDDKISPPIWSATLETTTLLIVFNAIRVILFKDKCDGTSQNFQGFVCSWNVSNFEHILLSSVTVLIVLTLTARPREAILKWLLKDINNEKADDNKNKK